MAKSKDSTAKVVSTKSTKTTKAPKKSAEQIQKERNLYRQSAHFPKARTAG